jgi:signal transduction histidine kinase
VKWPRSLFARLALIFLAGILLAQSLAFWITMTERDQATTNLMMGYVEREVTSSVALLDHLPPAERTAWLPKLARRSYQFVLGPGISGPPLDAQLSARVAKSINSGIGKTYALTANAIPGPRERLQVHLQLSDGSPLTIDFRPMPGMPMSPWLPAALLAQLALLAGSCWLAVRLATRPLHELANAADALGPDLKAVHLPEDGPTEVARAARAFNAMQGRIAMYMADRIQILASISHDLQTPITRMRLRLDLADDSPQSDKMRNDLLQMESLVREGVTYARTLHGTTEEPRRVDLDALFDTLVCEYTEAGQAVQLRGKVGNPIMARPQALRRVVGNLLDNALKFADAAELTLSAAHDGSITIAVLDRGPGIPEQHLADVFTPFYRLETSRSRDTGGTGLGLAIARQLALAMDGDLTLHNRDGGGLEARLVIKA